MAFILLATPNHPQDVQGEKGEIIVYGGTLKMAREKAIWWQRQGETTRIVNSTTGKEVE